MTSLRQYLLVFGTFARNSLIRDMTFRANFIIEFFSSLSWVFMNLGFYILIFRYTPSLGVGTGWGKYEFFAFTGTGLMINSLAAMLFMTNADNFGNFVRQGNLDFLLLKPIDTQFIVSLQRIEWSSSGNFFVGLLLLLYSLRQMNYVPSAVTITLYIVYMICGLLILYSLMFMMASTSVWLGRNETLFDFWFYIVNFARYPMEIYEGRFGRPFRWFFTFIIPVLVAVNVPARFIARPLKPQTVQDWALAGFTIVATVVMLVLCRLVFLAALRSYRSASS
ncbi:ABC-2 family transporter protein [Thermogutta sp.]|uniref:ABC transporter permease n=1 Tax=Thermogutta sp. TaxID=1962930 RepID=UPI0026013DCB|nr:ABC-2 family transporter protein [Thermogutta sp.]